MMIKKRNGFPPLMALLILSVFVGFFCMFASCACAGEGGGNQYPGGNEDFMAGALPPAGTKLFLNYFTTYNASNFKDNSGHNVTIPGLGKLDFNLQVVANVFRYVDVTKLKVLGGDFVWHVIVPVAYSHASLSAGLADLGGQSKTALGDIEFGVGVQWHPTKTFHHIAAFDFVAPTGRYNKDDTVNIGRNYWSFNPIWVFTYLGDKDSPIPGFEVSSKFLYWINTTNTDTNYLSGQEFSFDYLVGQHFGPWGVGVNGHYLYQTTDDKQHGSTAVNPFSGIADGNRGRYFSIGPIVQYNLPPNKPAILPACITLKYQKEVYSQNRPYGDHFWLKSIWAF